MLRASREGRGAWAAARGRGMTRHAGGASGRPDAPSPAFESFEDRVVDRRATRTQVGVGPGQHDPDSGLEPERFPGLQQDPVARRLDDPAMEVEVMPRRILPGRPRVPTARKSSARMLPEAGRPLPTQGVGAAALSAADLLQDRSDGVSLGHFPLADLANPCPAIRFRLDQSGPLPVRARASRTGAWLVRNSRAIRISTNRSPGARLTADDPIGQNPANPVTHAIPRPDPHRGQAFPPVTIVSVGVIDRSRFGGIEPRPSRSRTGPQAGWHLASVFPGPTEQVASVEHSGRRRTGAPRITTIRWSLSR